MGACEAVGEGPCLEAERQTASVPGKQVPECPLEYSLDLRLKKRCLGALSVLPLVLGLELWGIDRNESHTKKSEIRVSLANQSLLVESRKQCRKDSLYFQSRHEGKQ